MSILRRKKENCSGSSRPSSLANLSNEFFRHRRRGGVGPIIQPACHSCAEIARTFGEESFRQFGGAALEIALAHFNHSQKLVSFALPFGFSMFVPEPVAEKTQVVSAAEQIGQSAQIVAQVF